MVFLGGLILKGLLRLTAHQKREALEALADGMATQASLARRFNVSQSTISRLRLELTS
jgi:transposase-like protein